MSISKLLVVRIIYIVNTALGMLDLQGKKLYLGLICLDVLARETIGVCYTFTCTQTVLNKFFYTIIYDFSPFGGCCWEILIFTSGYLLI